MAILTSSAWTGHDQPSISGVFGVPCGPNDPILPGCQSRLCCFPQAEHHADSGKIDAVRFVKLIPLGTAFSGQWRRCAESTDSSDPAQASLLAHAQSMPRNSSSSNRSSDSYARQQRQETKEETLDRIMSVIDSFKRDQSWNGPAYDLLNKNCNHFTEVLAFALTGKHIPAWINRAAWIGLRLPCLVPDVSFGARLLLKMICLQFSHRDGSNRLKTSCKLKNKATPLLTHKPTRQHTISSRPLRYLS